MKEINMRKHATILFALFFGFCLSLPIVSLAEQNQKSNFVPINWYAHAESTSAFKQRIDININNLRIEDALNLISKKGDTRLTYGEDILPDTRVTLKRDNIRVLDALQAVVSNTNLKVMASPSGQVVIMKKEAPVLNSIIRGTVYDEQTGETIPGASVYLEDTGKGDASDTNGEYTITDVEPGDYKLTARFLGYTKETKEISVGSNDDLTFDFQLSPSSFTMDEMVVSGMVDPIDGKKIPFSIGKINKENIASVPTTNSALGAIQGKVAGAQIVRSSGQPGTGVYIMLRSPTSVEGGNSPMYVVDGVVLGTSFGGTTVDLESLDIEDVEVIKGAAAASLYGSRAAGGVISITTSRGKGLNLDETRITYRGELGLTQAASNFPVSNSHYFKTNEQGQFIDGEGNVTTDPNERVISDDEIMDNEYGVPLYDNLGTFYKPGAFKTHSVSVSQRLDRTNFMISANNYKEEGSLANSEGFERNNFRINVDHIVNDRLYLSASAYHNRGHRDNNASGFQNLLLYPRTVDLGKKDEDGNYLIQPDSSVNLTNPIWAQASSDDYTDRQRTLASIDLKYTPFEWLTASTNFSYDRSDIISHDYTAKGTPTSPDENDRTDGSLSKSVTYTDALNGSFSLSALKQFGKLNSRITLRGMFESETYNYIGASGNTFALIGLPDLDYLEEQYASSYVQEIKSNGFFVQTGLDYDDKYIGDLLIRRDGSSLFGPDARWNTYYRVGLSYRLSQENWWNFDNITEFKLRYSRGTAGGRPDFGDRFETWTYDTSSGSVSRSTLGNRNLKPERTTEQEFGLDMIFFDKYSVQLTYVNQLTDQQLLTRPLQAVYGYPAQVVNDGKFGGTTMEATIEAQIFNSRDTRWSATLVADRSTSKIKEWNRPSYFSGFRLIEEGANLSDMYGEYHYRSLDALPENLQAHKDQFQVNDDGYVVAVGSGNSWNEGLQKDLWGSLLTVDGEQFKWGHPIVARDEEGNPAVVKIGSSNPDLNLGLLNNFFYKGFTVHAHLHAQIGGNVYNYTRQRLIYYNNHGDMDQRAKTDASKKTIGYYQTLYNYSNYTKEFSEDGSYLKLREIALKYTLRSDKLSQWGLTGVHSISFGAIGRNLFTISNYSGFDPEVGSVLQRIDNFGYPVTSTFTGTIEVSF
ncbi:MAG: SusC/RagA family TonB-linked outer membrane protein [Balneolaceae bacterium]|nr:SusC/RagA family TonB-linked outer membrane protein [Balneolaceae bacterium]